MAFSTQTGLQKEKHLPANPVLTPGRGGENEPHVAAATGVLHTAGRGQDVVMGPVLTQLQKGPSIRFREIKFNI